MARGKRATQGDAPTEHDREAYWRMADKAGGPEKLAQWIGERPPQPTRGAPQNEFDKEFLALFRPFFGSVLPTRRGFRKFIAQIWQGHKDNYANKSLSPEARNAWDPRHLGPSANQTARRLWEKITHKD